MNCDPLARWYRVFELLTMGRALQRRRCEFLAETPRAKMILVLGDGDGRFLECLCRANSRASVHCVDSSAKMLAAARARSNSHTVHGAADDGRQIIFAHADARQWMPPAGTVYDLVITHFFLDCFEETEAAELIQRFAKMLRPGGKWIVSEFRIPPSGWASWRARLWVGGLYRLFGTVTGLKVRSLPRYRPALEAAGFQLERAVIAEAGMLISELWEKPDAGPVSR